MPELVVCPNPGCRQVIAPGAIGTPAPARCPSCDSDLGQAPTGAARSAPDRDEQDVEAGAAENLPPPLADDLASGERFAGRYLIVRKIDQGGMGVVYLAHDEELDRQVALKIPFRHADLDYLQRFQREARAGAQLTHQNICRVFDVSKSQGVSYLTMDFIEGEPLSKVVKAAKQGLPIAQALGIVRSLAGALAEAHAHKIIHRDLKPANVMIRPDGSPVLMDFGLARRESDDTLTMTGVALGTPAYMPPEQARGDVKAIGPRSDIYSLGVILYELLTGKRPFTGATMSILGQILGKDPSHPSTRRHDLPHALGAVCLKAMAKDPAARYGSMLELSAALGVAEESLVTGKPTRPSRARALVLAATVLVAVLGLGTYLAWTHFGAAGRSSEAPAHASNLWGGIEIGAKGIKAVYLPIDENNWHDPTRRMSLPSPKVNNVTLSVLAKNGDFTESAMNEARKAVAAFYQNLTKTAHVAPEQIRLVVSSGLLASGKPSNYADFAKAMLLATEQMVPLVEIDQRTEVELAILGGVPPDRWKGMVFLDIGNGNSKLGYYVSELDTKVAEAKIFGIKELTKTSQERAAATGRGGMRAFDEAAREYGKTLGKLLEGDLLSHAGFSSKDEFCVSGGVFWAVVILKDPARWAREDVLVAFSLDSVEALREEVISTGSIPKPDLASFDDTTRKQVKEQVDEVLEAFTPMNLLAGTELILGFADALGWRSGGKKLYFTKAGLNAWIVAYLYKAATAAK